MQYSLFTHGTGLEIETPDALAGSIKVGWGTQILFRAPVAENVEGLPVSPEVGPGSWFTYLYRLPLPRLEEETLAWKASHCCLNRVTAGSCTYMCTMESIFFRNSIISSWQVLFCEKETQRT